MFYMQSLFASFNSMGSIYVGLVQAVGAADKVRERGSVWKRHHRAAYPHL